MELVVVAAGVLVAPPKNEDPAGFGCSAGLFKLKKPLDCAGCDRVADVADGAGAGVVD